MSGITYIPIISQFESMFPAYINDTIGYGPEPGHDNSVHIWMKDGRQLVFTYRSEKDWLFETFDHFKMRMYIDTDDAAYIGEAVVEKMISIQHEMKCISTDMVREELNKKFGRLYKIAERIQEGDK